MPSYVTPKKNTAYVIEGLGLVSQANPLIFQVNPTLATGDVKVSIDGGALANVATLPSVTPAGSSLVTLELSAAEMNGDNIAVQFKDAAGDEWADLAINIQTSARQVDDLIHSSVPDLEAIIADSVPADGTRPSIRQALLMINRFLQERSVSGTTVTVTKEDGSTSNMTFTIDDAATPTSITRTT